MAKTTPHASMADFASSYNKASLALTTQLSGTVTVSDIHQWSCGLRETVRNMQTGSTFKLLVDLSEYKPASIEAHQAMRLVVPQFLADHGLRPAYLDLFDEQYKLDIVLRPRVRCTALANVHHDAVHMRYYQLRAGKPEQKFLADRAAAIRWLETIPTV